MPNTLPSQTTPEPVATPPVQKNRSASEPLPVTAPDAVQEPVVPDDAARAADILSLAVRHGMPELAERAIREHVNLDAFRAQVLDAISSRNSESVPGFRVSMGQDEGEKFRAAAADSLVLRTSFGHVVKTPAPGAEELRGFTLAELARDCLRRPGSPRAATWTWWAARSPRPTSRPSSPTPRTGPCWPGPKRRRKPIPCGRARPRRRTSASIPARRSNPSPRSTA